MTTWTPATEQAETWTENEILIGVFARDVFSHEYKNGTRVFALGAGGVWDPAVTQSETWAPA